MKVKQINNSGENYLAKFKPLQVEVRSSSREDFEYAMKLFKNLVQRENVISDYKERQSYEKPSDKKRRKRREAEEKRFTADAKQKIISGEEKRVKQKKED